MQTATVCAAKQQTETNGGLSGGNEATDASVNTDRDDFG